MIKKNNQNFSFAKGTTVIGKIIKAGQVIYENFKNLIVSGIPPLTLSKSKGVDLVDYKIYGNSVQEGTPTLEVPIEIESVGEKTKNLFNINIISNAYCTVVDDALEVKITAGNSSTSCSKTLKELCPDLEVGKTYIMSYKVNTNELSFISIGSYSVQANYWKNGAKRTISEEDLEAIVRFGTGGSGIRTVIFSDIQVTEEKTDVYEPYGKYKIPVKARGKNLFDINKYSSYIDISKYKVGDNLVLSLKDKYQLRIAKSAGAPGTAVNDNKFAFTMTQEFKDVGRLYIVSTKTYSWETKENLLNQNVQLEYGTVATPFESYVEPIITNIYLDEPLTINDYIHYKEQELSKNGVTTNIELPNIPTIKGTCILEVNTDILPSNVEVIYKGKA